VLGRSNTQACIMLAFASSNEVKSDLLQSMMTSQILQYMLLTVAKTINRAIMSVDLSIRHKLKLIPAKMVKQYLPQLTRCGKMFRVS
jgi:hypothetical protein